MYDELIADGIDEDGQEDVDASNSTDAPEELLALARC
jgi:hypothetical protein